MKKNFLILISLIAVITSCGTREEQIKEPKTIETKETLIKVPEFNKDSAYYFVEKQVLFGPRVPNTNTHAACALYLESKLKDYTDTVIVQRTRVRAYDGTTLNISNIIGAIQPNNNNRILLCAHWDTRPIAEKDPDPDMRNKPIDGANDGASGVGVLLEIARILKDNPPPIGIDFIFFDAEDYGQPDNSNLPYMPDTWALGSQFWAKNPHKQGYFAKYGILLDMVGAKDATFLMEGYSMMYAPHIVRRVWNTAAKLGYSNYFIMQETNPITDDHYYINTIINIPTINIIHYDRRTGTGFFPYWHTHEDNMEKIDKNTLKAVGQTLLQIIFEEK